jgi:alcohol dehydrogenase (cytochrome c)
MNSKKPDLSELRPRITIFGVGGAGGGPKTPDRYGSLKAVDPVTGDIKASLRLDYPNYSGALATAGNLVFIGLPDGSFTAHDEKTLKELYNFNVGTGIMRRRSPMRWMASSTSPYSWVRDNGGNSLSPELKNTSTASMLFVFSL